MAFNVDGFNERSNFIHNANNSRMLNKMSHNYDNSLAQMRMNERKPNIETVRRDTKELNDDVQGSKENFVLRNHNMNNINMNNMLNRNLFKK